MSQYHLIKSVLGGSDVYDENGQQVGYSLPSFIGKGEDFYDMNGNPLGQSFEGAFGGMPVENGILWCATELNSKEEIDSLVREVSA